MRGVMVMGIQPWNPIPSGYYGFRSGNEAETRRMGVLLRHIMLVLHPNKHVA
jgi:hypothetical protein